MKWKLGLYGGNIGDDIVYCSHGPLEYNSIKQQRLEQERDQEMRDVENQREAAELKSQLIIVFRV